MKLILIILSLGLASASALATATVEFTPVASVVKFEGAARHLVRFRCVPGESGSGTIDYTPPWPITGSGDRATMMIPNTDATAVLRRVRTSAPLDFDDEERVLAWAREFLPEYAEALELGAVEHNPLAIDGQATVELTARYSLFGRPVAHSLLICRRAVSRDSELFVFELQTKPAEFEQFHRIFQRSLHSIVGF